MTDPISFAARFEEHRPRLRRLAQRMLGSTAEVDDIVQEVWLRASAAGADDVENYGGWLTTIASRTCLNVLRARAGRGEIPLDDEGADPVIVREPADGRSARAGAAGGCGRRGAHRGARAPLPRRARGFRAA